MLIKLSGRYATFTGNILGASFEDGVGDVPSNIANLIAASIGGVMEIDAEGEDVAPVDPGVDHNLIPEQTIPYATSVFPVNVEALAATVAAQAATIDTMTTTIADLTDRIETLESAE